MAGEVRRYQITDRLAFQVNYLHAGPRHGHGICKVCLGVVTNPRYSCCYPCSRTWQKADGVVADLVVPITYRNGSTGQHSQDLRMYKERPRSEAARKNLAILFREFCKRHISCVKQAAGITHFSHVAFVPSTRNPGEVHPLQILLEQIVRPLRTVNLEVNREISETLRGSREFNRDWFLLDEIPDPRPETDVLLIDDTWVTGSRVQSAAYRLKRAGARKVAVVVLARQIDPDFSPARPLIDRITHERFDPNVCAVHVQGKGVGI